MFNYIRNRLLLAIPTLLAVSFITFFLGYLSPGSPIDIMLGQHSDPARVRQLEHEYGLDRPAMVQYGSFLWNAVSHGDLGRSFGTGQRPVTTIIAEQFPTTAFLACMAMLTAVAFGIPAGVIAALKHNRALDRGTMGFVLLMVSTPAFVFAPLLMLYFSLNLKWLPSSGWEGQEAGFLGFKVIIPDWQYLVMPMVVLAARPAALLARFMRSSMLETIRQDYIRTANAKGLSPSRVLFKHGLKNAFLPVLTVLGNTFGGLLTGSFVVENIFTIPGIGYQSVQSILSRDYPVIQGVALLVAVIFIGVNLVVDILYGVLDPRVRYEGAK
jgi:ABC-type dipeptide/oligopeptide/nickel transport system permease component